MFYSTEDALKQGLNCDDYDRHRWLGLREVFITQCRSALYRNQFDMGSMFATQAQFCREALNAKEVLRQYESDKEIMEIINQC